MYSTATRYIWQAGAVFGGGTKGCVLPASAVEHYVGVCTPRTAPFLLPPFSVMCLRPHTTPNYHLHSARSIRKETQAPSTSHPNLCKEHETPFLCHPLCRALWDTMAFRASVARLARASVKMREMPLPSAQEFNPPVAKNAVLGAVLFGLVGGVYYMTVHRMQEQVRVFCWRFAAYHPHLSEPAL